MKKISTLALLLCSIAASSQVSSFTTYSNGSISNANQALIEFSAISNTNVLENLPVAPMHYFAIASNNGIAQITWITENNLNSNYYELQRSFDNEDFKTIAMILGAKSTIDNKDYYEYADKSSVLKNNSVAYYRLKQVYTDGQVTYSSSKEVSLNGKGE
jgi:hypothetical protein